MAEAQYTRYYVAFLDILGFKNLVNGSQATCQKILNIYKAFGDMQKAYFGEEYEKTQDVKMKVMSDSICLYIEADIPNALDSLISFCIAFQYDLLTLPSCIFVRGGIALGDMYVENDIVFGPALTEAYLLEEQNAKVPRIIIQKKVLDYGKSQVSEGTQPSTDHLIFRDTDAFYTLDYFAFLCLKGNNETIIERVKTTVSHWLDTTIDESIRQKYLYVEKHMRRYLKEKMDA